METSDPFKLAEEEHLRLKGLFAAGRLTREQFDDAVAGLSVQDAQGQTWVLGDNEFWVKYDGPPRAKVITPVSAPAAPPQAPVPAGSRRFPLIAAVGAGALILVCSLAACGLFLWFNRPAATVVRVPTPTVVIALVPAPAPPDLPIGTATLALPSETATEAATAMLALPSQTATEAATATAMSVAAVPSVAAATTTPTVALPSGLYVTGLRTEPAKPVRRQDIVFVASFLNTFGSVQNSRWLVYIYRPTDLNRQFGETTPSGASLVVGLGEQRTQGWKLAGGGSGCMSLVARVASMDDHKKATFFKRPDGSIFEMPFEVC